MQSDALHNPITLRSSMLGVQPLALEYHICESLYIGRWVVPETDLCPGRQAEAALGAEFIEQGVDMIR
jgi:hypothetical protein